MKDVPEPAKDVYPMRINKYLASMKYCTRREADQWVMNKRVYINNVLAVLGSKVEKNDVVEVKGPAKRYNYYAYNKPRGIITHSPQGDEESIADIFPIKNVFPIGRLDKESYGLIILTDDGRITDALLNPAHEHEKEYEVTTLDDLPQNFKSKMEAGVDIGDYVTKPCQVEIVNKNTFRIVITEGKKHQIRRMCGAFGQSAEDLQRIRIMNVKLGSLAPGEYRALQGAEIKTLLSSLGV